MLETYSTLCLPFTVQEKRELAWSKDDQPQLGLAPCPESWLLWAYTLVGTKRRMTHILFESGSFQR